MTDGAGCGEVKPDTVQYGGRVPSSDLKQALVMDDVPFGLIRRILISLVEVPVIVGKPDMACLR